MHTEVLIADFASLSGQDQDAINKLFTLSSDFTEIRAGAFRIDPPLSIREAKIIVWGLNQTFPERIVTVQKSGCVLLIGLSEPIIL